MQNITRTVYASLLQTSNFLGVQNPFLENSTLNEALDIYRADRPSESERTSASLFVWGNMGHDSTRKAGGFSQNIIVPHRTTDGGLFNMLPFVLREVNNDLSPAQQRWYALRKLVTVGPKNYYAYYGRRYDKTGVVPMASYVSVDETGKEDIKPFVPNSSNLKPTRPATNSEGVWVNSGDYVTVKARIMLAMTESEVQEMIEVARIVYGEDGYATMSEIALCTCTDRVVRATGFNGATFNFNEAIVCQIASHLNVNYDLAYANQYLNIAIDVGANEPLYRLSPYDTVSNNQAPLAPAELSMRLVSINGVATQS